MRKMTVFGLLLTSLGGSGVGSGLAAATVDDSAPPPAGWKELNLTGWSLRVPTNVYAVRHAGMDSLGGTISGGGIRISYDQGLGPLRMPLSGGPTTKPEPPLSAGVTSTWEVKGVSVRAWPLARESGFDPSLALGLHAAWTDAQGTGWRLTLNGSCEDKAELSVLRQAYESFRPHCVTIRVPTPDPASWRAVQLEEGATVGLPPDLVVPAAPASLTCRFVGLRLDLHCTRDPTLAIRRLEVFKTAEQVQTRHTNVVVDGLYAVQFARPAKLGDLPSGKFQILGVQLSRLGPARNESLYLWTECEDTADWVTATALVNSLRIGEPLRPAAGRAKR